MKLLITTVTMIFISFGANADMKGNVEEYYKLCKPYVANGLSTKGMRDDQLLDFAICSNVLVGHMIRGDMNCKLLKNFRNAGDINSKQFRLLSIAFANKYASLNQIVTSFVGYAENNPNVWRETLAGNTVQFINLKFPCKLKDTKG